MPASRGQQGGCVSIQENGSRHQSGSCRKAELGTETARSIQGDGIVFMQHGQLSVATMLFDRSIGLPALHSEAEHKGVELQEFIPRHSCISWVWLGKDQGTGIGNGHMVLNHGKVSRGGFCIIIVRPACTTGRWADIVYLPEWDLFLLGKGSGFQYKSICFG